MKIEPLILGFQYLIPGAKPEPVVMEDSSVEIPVAEQALKPFLLDLQKQFLKR